MDRIAFPLGPIVFLSFLFYQIVIKVSYHKIGYGFGSHQTVDLALGVFVVGQEELLGGDRSGRGG